MIDARIAANRQAVPDAASHVKVYTAPYGAALPTAGGMRRIALCSPGQLIGMLYEASSAWNGLYPHSRTNTTSSAYGAHASAISRPLCRCSPRVPDPRTITSSAAIAAREDRMSVNWGPMKLDTTNCVPANAMPHAAAAPNTLLSPLQPLITAIRYAGTKREIGAQMRPTPALNRSRGSPVVTASVVIGIAIDPNATGAVFASRQIAAALNGEKPSPVSMAAATATGVPKPAAPSMNAPNAKAISSACSLGSVVRCPMESFRMSNLPVSRMMRYSRMAENTTQPMGKRPKAAPYVMVATSLGIGIP